jgi:hypothetical protein
VLTREEPDTLRVTCGLKETLFVRPDSTIIQNSTALCRFGDVRHTTVEPDEIVGEEDFPPRFAVVLFLSKWKRLRIAFETEEVAAIAIAQAVAAFAALSYKPRRQADRVKVQAWSGRGHRCLLPSRDDA